MTELYAGKSLTEESVQEILVNEPPDKSCEQSRCFRESAPDYLLYIYFVWIGHVYRYYDMLNYCMRNNRPS